MHELALTEAIVDMVGEHACGQRVRRVTLEVGKLTCVAPAALRFCFDLATAGTPLTGASLDIIEIEARARCRTCGATYKQETSWTPCSCGSNDGERIAGEELRVKAYELAAEAVS